MLLSTINSMTSFSLASQRSLPSVARAFRFRSTEARQQNVVVVGCGLFGKLIAENLQKEKRVVVTVTSRRLEKAKDIAQKLNCRGESFDLDAPDESLLESADVVVNTAGPWTQQSLQLAKLACRSKAHYIDIADNRSFVRDFSEQVNSEAKENGVYAISGASTCPAVSMAVMQRALQAVKEHTQTDTAVLKSAKIVVSGALRTPFGPGTIQSVLSYAGATIKQRQGMDDSATVVGWRDCSFEAIRGLPERRLVANVETPELDLLVQDYKEIESVRVQAGIGNVLPTLGTVALSYMPETLRSWLVSPRRSLLLSKAFGWIHAYIPSGGTFDVGAMKVSCIVGSKDGDGSLAPFVYEWSLLGERGHGIQVPASPATMLTMKLLNGFLQDTPPGAYSANEPFLSLNELEQHFQSLGNIRTHEHVRPFISPFTCAIGSRDAAEISPILRAAHAAGGVFEGELEVIGPTGWKQLPLWFLCTYASLPPSSKGNSLPVKVTVEPRPCCDGSGMDEIWFVRTFGDRPFVSQWRMANGVAKEKFRFDQHFAMEVALRPPDGFDLIGRAMFPLPFQRHALSRMSVSSESTVDKEAEHPTTNLTVHAMFPLLSKEPFFGYRGKLRILRTWFGHEYF